ncbi:MAG: HD domain-containing protein [Candidatus Atribacteria bacterium]|nr:HD domain-containing protein [Candidatus Atribacteria bacterium]
MIEYIIKRLKNMISPSRFSHSIRVAEEARKLAIHFGEDPEKSYLTGLLHDSARALSVQEMVRYLPSFFLPIGYSVPAIFHAFAGPRFITEQFGITDYSILRAVCWHATACEDMNNFDKILFVADLSESGRRFRESDTIRQVLQIGLQEAFMKVLALKVNYLLANKKIIYPTSLEAWNKTVAICIEEMNDKAQKKEKL